jgi:lysophospholipase L1-like esterase
MILFLGDSFTWGQGLYFEKWEADGIDVLKWKSAFGDLSYYPHELLGYDSDVYRKSNHFPALVAKHYDRSYNVKWGNGGSNWDIIHQLNLLESLSPQYNKGVDLIVIQLTDFYRNNNRVLHGNDIYKRTSMPDRDYLEHKDNLETQIVEKMITDVPEYQLRKIKEICDIIGKKWICISWRGDMGKILKNKYKENYVPFFYKDKEYEGFEIALMDDSYSLEEFNDGHFNSKGCELVADSIIKKIEEIGGRGIFNYLPFSRNLI